MTCLHEDACSHPTQTNQGASARLGHLCWLWAWGQPGTLRRSHGEAAIDVHAPNLTGTVNPNPEAPGDLRSECTQVLSEKTHWPKKVVLPFSRPTQTARPIRIHSFIHSPDFHSSFSINVDPCAQRKGVLSLLTHLFDT